jgi:hypothetical protein
VICELARKNPKNYLTLSPVFFKLMTTSSNNWMLIKIIKLVSSFSVCETCFLENLSTSSKPCFYSLVLSCRWNRVLARSCWNR